MAAQVIRVRSMNDILHWGQLTGEAVADLARRDAVALLPMAAVEQHGPHLPLNTDVVIGEGIVAAAGERYGRESPTAPLVILPTMSLGASLEHTGYAGTLSLSAEQTMAQLRAVGEGVARAGIRRLLVFNSHGGNKAALDMAALQLRSDHGLLVVKASYFRFAPPRQALPAAELAHGLHGGALETAMMLHLAPARVCRDRLAEHRSLGAERADAGLTLGPEGEAGFAWRAEDLHPSGVTGNAALADARTGQRLVAHFAARLAVLIEETAGFDLSRLGTG